MLDQKIVENQLKNFKIREGPLYKRSKFLKEWRQRWVVLTMNYFFTFTNKTCTQLTDALDLKQIKSYSSYMRKVEEMIPAGFKIRTQENLFYFCTKSCNEKWSWIVTFERLMDYKFAGASTYNNLDAVKTKGFISQNEYEAKGKNQTAPQAPPNFQTVKTAEQAKNEVDQQADKIMKSLMNQQEQLKKKEEEVSKKQKQLEQQQALLQIEKEKAKKVEAIQEAAAKKQKQVPAPIPVESKPIEKLPQKHQKLPEKHEIIEKTQEQLKKEANKVSELKNIFEKKIENLSKTVGPTLKYVHKEEKKQKVDEKELIHTCRNKIIVNLFQQFHEKAYEYPGLKFIIDFIVKITSDRNLGYQSFLIYQAKTNHNRLTFAQIFIELLTDYKDYENADFICKFVQAMIFQAPGLFNPNQLQIVQFKLLQFFDAIKDDKKLSVILKSMFILHKLKNYPKSQALKSKLSQFIKKSNEEQAKNWARKLNDAL